MWPLYQVKPFTCIHWPRPECPAIDDKMLMVWDLYPTVDTSSRASPNSSSMSGSSSPPPRLQPTAYVIAFPHPLTTVNSHPSSSKEFLVSDARGSIFLTDWRSDPEDSEFAESWRLVELVEPYALAATSTGLSVQGGWAAWRRDNADMYVDATASPSLAPDHRRPI